MPIFGNTVSNGYFCAPNNYMDMVDANVANIGIVIILFRPSQEELERTQHIASLYEGVIVDNSENNNFPTERVGKMAYVPLNGNYGIATAQNVGFRRLLDNEAISFIVLFDQDSCFDDSYPFEMARLFQEIRQKHPNLAVLGPTVVRKETGISYGSAIHKNRDNDALFNAKAEIIASGSCMSREALEDVGLNDEKLFIDFVDCEWCWRAQARGYICGTTPLLSVFHKVGQRELHIGRHVVIISAPFRYYYQYRNLIILSFRSYVPLKFKFFKGVKALLRFFYFPFVVKGGGRIWINMSRGIIAGIKELF